jgi:hypothetical protein
MLLDKASQLMQAQPPLPLIGRAHPLFLLPKMAQQVQQEQMEPGLLS